MIHSPYAPIDFSAMPRAIRPPNFAGRAVLRHPLVAAYEDIFGVKVLQLIRRGGTPNWHEPIPEASRRRLEMPTLLFICARLRFRIIIWWPRLVF